MLSNNTKLNNFINEALYYIAYIYSKELNVNIKSISNIYPDIFDNIENENRNIDNYILDKNYFNQFYQSIISLELKKDLGQFYTEDDNLIDFMLKPLDILSGKILEPSCGIGIFLIKIIKTIIIQLKSKNYSSEEIINYIQENIYGNDFDINALRITEINILLVLLPLIIDAKKSNKNFKMNKFNLSNFDFTIKNIFSLKFSIVIGNPPFITMYGKQSRNMDENKRAYFNTFDFVQNKKGNNKFNIAMFFLENGFKILEEKGRMVYILDISFFETAFKDIRKYIVQNMYINFLITDIKAFKNVNSGQIILDVTNIKKYNNNINIINYSFFNIKYINQALWDDENNNYKFFSPLNTISKSINNKIQKYETLQEIFPNKSLRTCCALTGKTDEFIVNENELEKNNNDIFPYIEGSKGLKGKFYKPIFKRYIKYDYDLQIKLSNEFKKELEILGVKNKKRVTLGDKEAYLAPKLFIRQSSYQIIATYSNEPLAANNSIYILTTKKYDIDSINKLKYICGILNSDLITFYCHINKIIRFEKGKTPQIKISDLKSVRININENYYYEVIDIVNKLLIDFENINLLNRLNYLVYKIYKISPEEIQYINNYILKYK